MNHPFGTTRETALLMLSVVLVLLMVLFLRGFVFKVRWHLSEMMLVMTLCSIPVGIIFRNVDQSGQLQGIGDVIALAPYAFMSTCPILFGAWWGLRTAERVKETVAWKRLGLIAAGTAMVVGAIAVIPAAFMFLALLIDFNDKHFLEYLPFFCAASLLLPSILVERHYRRLRAAQLRAGRASVSPLSRTSNDKPGDRQ